MQNTESSHSKKLVVITGASSGIGERCVFDFSERGYPVLALARRVETMEKKFAGLIEKKKVLVEKVDVSNLDSFSSAVSKAEAYFKTTMDLLINNAGVMLLDTLNEQPSKDYELMVQTNIIGVLHGCKMAIKGMLERKTGTIINVSSVAGRKGFNDHSSYCGTKFFVHGFTETLRQEVAGSNVRVIIIAPGVVETELLSHSGEKTRLPYEEWKKSIVPLIPEDISKSILFAYEMPQRVCVREILIAPTSQAL